MKNKHQVLHNASSSCVTWQNVSALSLIRRMRLNGDDSHLSLSSEPLIKDEEAN